MWKTVRGKKHHVWAHLSQIMPSVVAAAAAAAAEVVVAVRMFKEKCKQIVAILNCTMQNSNGTDVNKYL